MENNFHRRHDYLIISQDDDDLQEEDRRRRIKFRDIIDFVYLILVLIPLCSPRSNKCGPRNYCDLRRVSFRFFGHSPQEFFLAKDGRTLGLIYKTTRLE